MGGGGLILTEIVLFVLTKTNFLFQNNGNKIANYFLVFLFVLVILLLYV